MMTRRKRWTLLGSVAVLACLALLAAGTPQGRALVKTTRGLATLEADPRVRYEPGVEANAAQVAAVLDRTIERVQAAHGTTFEDPLIIFVCGTQDSFNEFLAQPGGRATGTVVLGRLLLSPRSFRERKYEAVLGHELSHLLLRRRRGWGSAVAGVPGWFQEGLAVYASGGGGALPVTPEEARRAIVAGRTFVPEDEGAWRPRMAADHGVAHHQFYRQSGLFVEFLAGSDAEGWSAFLDGVHGGDEFGRAFEGHLGRTVEGAWREFVESVRSRGTAAGVEAGGCWYRGILRAWLTGGSPQNDGAERSGKA